MVIFEGVVIDEKRRAPRWNKCDAHCVCNASFGAELLQAEGRNDRAIGTGGICRSRTCIAAVTAAAIPL